MRMMSDEEITRLKNANDLISRYGIVLCERLVPAFHKATESMNDFSACVAKIKSGRKSYGH